MTSYQVSVGDSSLKMDHTLMTKTDVITSPVAMVTSVIQSCTMNLKKNRRVKYLTKHLSFEIQITSIKSTYLVR